MKTSIAASVALMVSFAMLFAYLDLYSPGNTANASNENISPDISNEKRVLLIGSSYVERLNATYIKQYLSENGLQQFQVYNIAKNGAGNPSQQSAFLEQMVSAHPTAVVYGLGFRELGYLQYTDSVPKCASVATGYGANQTSFSTPDVQDAIAYVQKMMPGQTSYFSNIADPKHVTVDLLKSHFEENSSSSGVGNSTSTSILGENFVEKRDPQFINIKNLDEVNKPLDYVVRVCPDDMNNEMTKLSEMVSVFKKNNIKVILFVPPFASSYLNAVGTAGTTQFLSALENFSNTNGLQLYDLHDRYVDLNIWADPQHVAQNPQVIVYSNDVAQIILKELKSFTTLRTVDTSANNLSYKDLSDADLRSVDLSGKNLTGANLSYSNLYNAKINETIFKGADLSHAYMHDLDLSEKNLAGTILVGADLTGANLDDVDLSNKNLTGTNLSGIDLSSTNMDGTILVGANLAHSNLTGIDLSNKNLAGTNLSGVNLAHTDLDGAFLAGAILDYSNLRNIDLAGKNLTGTSLKGVNLSGKDLTGTVLIDSNLAYANLHGNDLTGKNLTGAFLYKTNFIDADLTGSDLSDDNLRKTIFTGTNLNNVKLHNADLSHNDLVGTQLIGSDLRNAILPGINLANKDLTGTILTGSNLVNANLTGVDLSGKDLTGANLRGAHLDYAILTGINFELKNLTGTSLQGSDLARDVLVKAKMIHTNLVDADLSHSDLRNATIHNSNLTNADLSGANLSGANLSGDDLTGTILVGTNLVHANLTGVDLSKTITTVSGIKSTRGLHSNVLLHNVMISNFQSKTGWIKQSPSGNQSYDKEDFINGSQSMKLVTAGTGLFTVTRSNIISPALDLRNNVIGTWVQIDNSSKVKEFWMYFSNDGFKSSWYTCKIPISNKIKSGEWVKILVDPKESIITGTPDLSTINRIQIRLNDDSTGPVTLHVNEIFTQKRISQ